MNVINTDMRRQKYRTRADGRSGGIEESVQVKKRKDQRQDDDHHHEEKEEEEEEEEE